MKVLVFVEQRNGKLKSSAFEALSAAAKIGGDPNNVAAVIIGQGVDSLVPQLAGFGAEQVYVANDAAVANYNCPLYTNALEAAAKAFSPDVILAAASPMGKDLFPRAAARLNAGIVTDAVTLEAEGSNLKVTKPMQAGKVLAQIVLEGTGLKMVSLRPNVFGQNKTGKGSAKAVALDFNSNSNVKLTTKEVRKGTSERPDLTEASIIISGGRSLGSADNFKILHECVDVLHATVGASRAAVDSGYAPHDMQVGQTGKTVNPNLYIACGISGSIQHMAGMRTSKVIVAINTDPEAPIFTVADYGIVADLFKAVPVMTQKLKELL